MDRRTSPRMPIRLAAQLQIRPFGSWPCQISDVCAEGLFIRVSDVVEQQWRIKGAARQDQDLRVVFRDPADGQLHGLAARIARRIEGALGVFFTESQPASIGVLLRLCGVEGSEPSALRPGSDKGQFILRQCIRYLVNALEPLLAGYVGGLEDVLRREAESATSDAAASEFMDAAVQFRARQRPFCHQMAQALENPLRAVPMLNAGNTLALVDKSEFEDWLTLRVMITKAETQYRSSLLPLRMRLDKAGLHNETGQQHPLGPALICHALQQVLMGFHLPRTVEKVCLRHFEQQVLRHLDGLYDELNQILIRQGLLPDLDLSRYLVATKTLERTAPRAMPTPAAVPAPAPASPAAPTPTRPEPAPAPVPTPTASAPGPEAPTASVQSLDSNSFAMNRAQAEAAFSAVRSLLAALPAAPASRADTASTADTPPARAGARLITLGELQRHLQPLLSQTDGVSAAPVREQVHQLLQNENWRLTGEQQRELDVVDQFFTSLRSSSRLAPQTREWLQRLELPVLRSVLRDRAFFEDTNSTLRRVVNRIAQLGVRGTRPNPLVAQRLDALVQRVQADGGENPLLFEEVLAELDDLQARQNLVYRRNVERVMAAAEGAQKVEDARSAVSRELAGRLRGQRVPRALLTLINGGWRDLLILTHIRQGADSAPWRQYMGVLDTLLAWGRDRGTSIDLAELLGTIQEGLASISSNQVPAGHIRDELRRFLVSSVDMADEPVPDSLFDDPQADVRHLSETRHRSLQRWIGRAQKLQVGDWFNLQQEGAEPQPVRLVWIGRDHARFVFVNHQGMKVIEQDLFALASQLQQGLLVPDPAFAQPIVDESVDRMVRQVYDQLAWANAHDPLTGLLNRPELERSLLRQLEAEGTDGNWSLLQLDLRQFRLLNDTAGPAAGDQSLRAVADLLRTQGDESVLAARVGDNAFVLRVPTEEAHTIARQLMQAVAALPLHFAGRDYRLGASVGVAAGSPLLASPGAWLRAVEEACADAKRHGSGQVRSYQAAPAQVQQQDQIAARVASFGNLDDERLLLRCQKIIPLHADTRHGMGHGVLISLYDEDGELIPAQQLVRTAERYNRMQLIDRWVVGQVLDWMRGSPRALERAGQLYVTLSGHSLNDAALLEFIYEALSRQDAPLERLCFEINEASAIHNLDDVVEFMEELRELGCRFCLGHFGAGATAYALLKRLPVDVIKLDGLFARELAESPADQAMVRSMVDMAHFLGREVIASQIEQRAALEVFRNLGVDYAQGYVIEKPRLLDGL